MSRSIREQAETFAVEIMETLAGVIPRGNLGLDLVGDDEQGPFFLTCADPKGIELQVSEKTVMRLEIEFSLASDRSGKWLKVRGSKFAVVPEGKGTPFFRYDFDSEARSVPEAHINIHAHRDDLIAVLVGGGRGTVAKARRRGFVDRGRLPRVSSVHFPVGGKRFRPCLEDVLEAVMQEFGLDGQPGFQKVLDAGRTRYRDRQLRASVRDQPDAAIEALQQLGYRVEPA